MVYLTLDISPVVRTKITPPLRSPRTLTRSRVTQALLDALSYRLTIFQARAGYGKSTALTELADSYNPLIWYRITEEDNDPLVFLLHLCHATQRVIPDLDRLPIIWLDSWEGTRGPLPATGVMDQYLNALCDGLEQPTLLVLDDVHLIGAPEIVLLIDRLIGLAPSELHILLAAREPLQLPNLYRWQAQGEVLSLNQSLLAFTKKEINELFTRVYGYGLTADEADALSSATEGWVIALQLIWQGLRNGASSTVMEALVYQTTSLEGLFTILANEVLGVQPEDVQDFLKISATLRELTPDACDALIKSDDSAAMMAYLRRQDLFVVSQEEGGDKGESSLRLRYHHIFHNFLSQQTLLEDRQMWNTRAAAYYYENQNFTEAIYHMLQANDMQGAADLLVSYGNQLLNVGRLDTLASYLDILPPELLHNRPALLLFHGDLARLHSRFEEAFGWYQQAEELWRERGQNEGVARALRGQARVYLDTVDPNKAETLLQQCIRLTDGIEKRESQARLYELLAENKLNAGQIEEAENLHKLAIDLRNEGPSESQLTYRVLLRTGRLDQARQKLEVRAETERQNPVQKPRAHRETMLLLSLIYAFQGQAEEAYQNALEGTLRGVELNAPFITAVGHMRQGHALMLLPNVGKGTHPGVQTIDDRYEKARQQFEKSIRISRTLAVHRLRAEAFWGMCRVYGFHGELRRALTVAKEGIEIATQAGDEWVASLIRLTMGASLMLADRHESAEEWLKGASLGFQECGDPFSLSATRLWMCMMWFKQNDLAHLEQALPELLTTCRDQNYDYLFTNPTLLGFPDERMLIPLLILARDQDLEATYAAHLLKEMGVAEISIHPGYQLRVATLGTFQTWRGEHVIPPKGWRRVKSRQLFQILISHREAPLDRDQIIEYLWPEMDPNNAQRNFKVTLNTLNQVLEPERRAGIEPAFILREGTTYALCPTADIWLDAQVFKTWIYQANALFDTNLDQAISLIQNALSLYRGEYLPEARYDTWAAAEREHLAVLFLRSADRLVNIYIQENRFEDTVDLCQRVLFFDNCWERAYRYMMVAFDRLGDHGQAARTYNRCVKTLREELDISPTAETINLYKKITSKAEH
jgi:DNA-binding SARP family transcriptional activator